MANVNSTWITNAVATPAVLTDASKSVGTLREASSAATTANNQAQNDTVRLVRVPSNARISQVLFSAADASTAGAINVGIWQTAENGGAVVDADLFASALDLTGGPFENSDITFESDEYTYAESAKPLWEVLGLSADSNRDYDVVAEVSTTFNGGPTTLALKVRYVA
jgi:hypothetical protein